MMMIDLYPKDVRLYGIYEERKFLVRMDGIDLWLPLTQYRIFFHLAVGSMLEEDGWVDRDDLGEVKSAREQYIFKLRRNIENAMGVKWLNPLDSSRKRGKVRLRLPDDSLISIDLMVNKESADQSIRKCCFELAKTYENEKKSTAPESGEPTGLSIYEPA